jgi:hypothetical protein
MQRHVNHFELLDLQHFSGIVLPFHAELLFA